MKHIDLLFFDGGRVSDSFISDMGIEYIKNLEGFYSSEIYEVFLSAISAPLKNAEKIKERQSILKDFLRHPGIIHKMKSICDEIRTNKCQSSEDAPKRRLTEFQNVLYRSMETSRELASHLKNREFISSSLKDLRAQLDCREKTERLKVRINKLVEICSGDNIALSVEYGSGFKFKSASIYSSGKKEQKENAVLKFFQNKIPKQKEIPDGFYYNENFLIAEEVDGEKGIMPLVAPYAASVISNLNNHILSFCASLSKQLSFYIACMEIVKFMEVNGIPSVYPEFYPRGIKAENLLDFGLLLPKPGESKENAGVVTPNNFDGCGNSVYLISGANQGGKTTFLKSVGTAQLFAQCGLKVPAEGYICPVFNNFFSHFPKDEDEDLNFGKLAEELTRIKKDMPMITDNAFVLLNESFATTTEAEGYEIASDILRAVCESKAPPKILFVTHNYKLLKNRGELGRLLPGGTQVKSLVVSEGENVTDRTYKIIEGEAQEHIHTTAFLADSF